VKHILIFTGMKKIINISILVLLFSGLFIGTFTSCKNDEDLALPRLFSPVNFNVTTTKTVATFTWAAVDSAASYTLQVSTDSLDFSTPVLDTTITKLYFVKELAGETQFYARVRSNKSDTTKTKNSKFNSSISFKTPAENLFTGYGTNINTGKLYSAYMIDVHTLDIKWTPGANVTHLNLTSSDESKDTTVIISAAEAASGDKVVTSLSNSNWKVKVFNNNILRGTTYGLIEGDIILTTGGDLSATLNGAAAGQVILLAGGANYTLGNAEYKFSKNVKIRSTIAVKKSVVSLTGSGTTPPSTTSNMMSVVANSVLDSLVFENIDFTGYCDNNTAATKIGYLFSNKTLCTVTNLKFTNCNMHNFGNTPMRVSGGTKQHIINLIFNGCIINEFGYGSGYAFVNISKSNDFIDNISILNSTIYNFSYPLISIIQTADTPMSSLTISNCTFNQTTQNTSTRVLISLDFITLVNPIIIKNCIFGSSGSVSAGLKVTNATNTITVSGCYYTSDFIDETPVGGVLYSFKNKMTSYSGASTDLWNDPVNGDFSLKDAAFAGKAKAGDLRWY
jgi:hypothetical protein